jgi:hypothetical protein
MKKTLMILTAIICFGINANAQARITDVTYRSGEIYIKVEKNNGYSNCVVDFSIAPTDNMLILAVGGELVRTKYGTISSSSQFTTIIYSCAEKVENVPPICKVYNFELSNLYVSGNNCKEEKKTK